MTPRTTGTEPPAPDPLAAAIEQGVIRAAGRPADFCGVQVKALWDGRYRVNVLVAAGGGCVKVARSYFLTADGDGEILTSSPPLAGPG